MARKAAKSVTITMKSLSSIGGEPESIELITEGKLYPSEKDGIKGFSISYDDTEATGFEGSTTTVSCYGESLALMERKGSAESDLIIEKDRKHYCHYGTEYGDMLLGLYTHRIINRMTEEGGELYFKYTIDANSMFLSENEVYMDVRLK